MTSFFRCWKYWISGIAIGIVVFFIYMRWREGDGSWLGQAEAWIERHDLTIDLVTVWCLAVGFGVLMLVELVTWTTLLGQQDETDVGWSLRWKKLGYALIFGAMSSLYWLTLYGYYQDYVFGVWQRFGIRALVIIGIVVAAAFGVRFIVALKGENWGRSTRDVEQDARDVQQDARQNRLDIRDRIT